MATKLKDMRLTSVDLVRAGANQEADICLYKSAEGAENPETGIFKRFMNWLRENHGKEETVEKDASTFTQINDNRENRDKLWRYTDALTCSFASIQEDNELDSRAKAEMMRQSLQQFAAAMDGLIVELCEVQGDSQEDPDSAAEENDPDRFDVIVEVEKFNPYHDAKGRFASADGATSFTYKPGQGAMYDNAIRREKERTAAMAAGSGEPKKGLAAGMGEEHAKAIEKIVQDNAPQEVKAMWDKHGDGIVVGDAHYTKTAHSGKDGIFLDVDKDAAGQTTRNGDPSKSPYQTSIHESAHAIDDIVTKKVGYDFAVEHNGGAFEKLLIQETNAFFKTKQKELSESLGRKVNIEETRKEVQKQLFAEKDYLSTGMLSDILGGATKGKFVGTSGHSKEYWTGFKTYWGKIEGHSVATEAFAHFTSIAANSKSAARLKSVFPESYKEYLSMCQFAASLD